MRKKNYVIDPANLIPEDTRDEMRERTKCCDGTFHD
jgi:hypothetical protein